MFDVQLDQLAVAVGWNAVGESQPEDSPSVSNPAKAVGNFRMQSSKRAQSGAHRGSYQSAEWCDDCPDALCASGRHAERWAVRKEATLRRRVQNGDHIGHHKFD